MTLNLKTTRFNLGTKNFKVGRDGYPTGNADQKQIQN